MQYASGFHHKEVNVSKDAFISTVFSDTQQGVIQYEDAMRGDINIFINKVNLLEVYYGFRRDHGREEDELLTFKHEIALE